MSKLESADKGMSLFRERKLPQEDLDKAVFKWYTQQRAEGVPVRGVDIQEAAHRLARHMNIGEFKCSTGWLWRFRRRHGIVNKGITGELLSADSDAVDPYVSKLWELMEQEGLQNYQIYNADETGLLYKQMPQKTQAFKHLSTTPGRKVLKQRLSVLVCANGDGCHRLKPVVVGKSAKPRALKDVMKNLPVHYHHNRSAWFTQDIIEDWFHHVFDPAVRDYQSSFYGIGKEDIKAVLLLDNAPAHPSERILSSRDGKIKTMFLPPNTTSLIQPMDQGVIESAKRQYRNLFLQQCLVVTEDGMDEEGYEDTRGKKTLENLKAYNIKSAIYNFAEAWKKVPMTTLRNAWCKLLKTPKTPATAHDFEGFRTPEAVHMLNQAGQGLLGEEEIEEWLDEDAALPGHHHQTDEEIVEEILTPEPKEPEEPAEEDKKLGPSLAACMDAVDTLLSGADKFGGFLGQNFDVLRIIRLNLMKQHQERMVQKKISCFFKPVPSPSDKRQRTDSDASTSSFSSVSLPSTSGSSTFSSPVPSVTPEVPLVIFDSSDEEL